MLDEYIFLQIRDVEKISHKKAQKFEYGGVARNGDKGAEPSSPSATRAKRKRDSAKHKAREAQAR